jgi:hypothetical protein
MEQRFPHRVQDCQPFIKLLQSIVTRELWRKPTQRGKKASLPTGWSLPQRALKLSITRAELGTAKKLLDKH